VFVFHVVIRFLLAYILTYTLALQWIILDQRPFNPVVSCAALSIFLQRCLNSVLHISFSISFLRVFLIITSHFYLVFTYFIKSIFTFTLTMIVFFSYFIVAK